MGRPDDPRPQPRTKGDSVEARDVQHSHEEQVEYWMERFFALQDQYAKLLNQMAEITKIVNQA